MLGELAGAAQAQWALCAAARGRPLPPDAELHAPPAPQDLQDALLEVSAPRSCRDPMMLNQIMSSLIIEIQSDASLSSRASARDRASVALPG